MSSIRDLERFMNICPEVDCSDYEEYPSVDTYEFTCMEIAFEKEQSVPLVFAFPWFRPEEKGYLDVYIWDIMLYPSCYRRYVLCKDHVLPKEAEDEFLSYTHSGKLCADEDMMNKLNKRLPLLFRGSHYNGYSPQSIGQALEHIYFTSHRSGVREILYKAELKNIAYDIEKIPDFDIVGTTPEGIVGHGLPLRLLRILNQRRLIENLFDEDKMELCKNVYASYGGYIEKRFPTKGQWKYLEELYKNGGTFGGEKFSRALYERMRLPASYLSLDYYEKYLQYGHIFPQIRKLRLPDIPDIWSVTGKLEKYCMLSGENSELGRKIEKRYSSKDSYEYHGSEYDVIMPGSVLELCEEAIDQSSCLMNYIEDHANGDTTILFIRKKEKPRKSFVTMEVRGGEIKQVYGTCNVLPGEEIFEFLETYAAHTHIAYDPYDILLDDETEEGEENPTRRALLIKYAPK